MTATVSYFELVAAELRAIGITIRRLPGEYCVNFRNGGDTTALMVEDLEQALELGRAMAAKKAAEFAHYKEASASQVAAQEDDGQGAAPTLHPWPQSPPPGTGDAEAGRQAVDLAEFPYL